MKPEEQSQEAIKEMKEHHRFLGEQIKNDYRIGIDLLKGIERREDWKDVCKNTGLTEEDWQRLLDMLPAELDLSERYVLEKLRILTR